MNGSVKILKQFQTRSGEICLSSVPNIEKTQYQKIREVYAVS